MVLGLALRSLGWQLLCFVSLVSSSLSLAVEEHRADSDQTEAPESAWAFDEDLPETDRQLRMRICFTVSVIHIQKNMEVAKAAAVQFMARQEQGEEEMTEQVALNKFLFNWVLSCYANIDDDIMDKVKQKKQLTEPEKSILFMQPSNQLTDPPGKRIWDLLGVAVKESQKLQDQAAKAHAEESQKKNKKKASGSGKKSAKKSG